MEEVIWIEVLSRQREVISRFRCAGPLIRIGRGYANDVVLDDPHVAPAHARVFRDDDGALIMEDLGSANGLVLSDGSRATRTTLDGEHPVVIGRTLVRIRDQSHPVPPERAFVGECRIWPSLLLLGTAFVASETLFAYLRMITEPKVSWLLTPILIVAGMLIVWTTAWALITRVFSGHAHFERSLRIPLVAILGYSLFNEVITRGAFIFSWSHLPAINFIGAWMAVAAACFAHLQLITPAKPALKAGIVGGVMAIAVLLQTAAQYDKLFGNESVGYLHLLQPPWMRLAPPVDADQFFAKAAGMKDRLDKARLQNERE
ncbi:FHA domain-containing protein [Telmatospirillum siberiense]|uniref:FHA domain-containing protein n=1 Tax=Telmatospirillum siberiense TaxID=382514 RepID=A0A2N3PWF1_9PROT|nr:FHA domain-containing protein [Telmatospirillum siberiense]PKU24708.1 hypothetical protein CWS72_10265 [Telmatospirillum siberiense]